MWQDILLQAFVLLTTLFMFSLLHNIPQKLLTRLRASRANSNPRYRAKHHFIQGAQLLSQARSSPSSSVSLAKSALSEAEQSISLNPKDAASHILKALALDLVGGRENSSSAVASLDTALSPPAVRSLGEEERADALVKRAEIRMRMNKGRRGRKGFEDSVEDLEEAVRIKGSSGRAWRLLGECYEEKGLKDRARTAYDAAAKSGDPAAMEAIRRLN